MKQIFLPLVLISFAVICLSIVHIDNVNKLDEKSSKLREKQELKINLKNDINKKTNNIKNK